MGSLASASAQMEANTMVVIVMLDSVSTNSSPELAHEV